MTEATSSGQLSIGEYLIKRLQDYNIGHVFGIPGDYILNFYGMLEKSPLDVVTCTREDCAGYAADAYARINGMSALCVTYCVGGLSVCNSIAGAYAEKSPVVLITGSPGMSERVNNPLLHHKVREFRTQMEVFEKLCVAGAEITDPVTAFREIDRVFAAAARFKRPVYLEIPRDMVNVVPHIGQSYFEAEIETDAAALSEAVEEARELFNAAKKPVILAGVEIHRFHLQDQLLALADKLGVPIAATLLGKSVISESHPRYLGLYEGAMGRQDVTSFVEESDLVIMLGTFMTDLNMGIWTAHLDPAKCIYVTSEQLSIRRHFYQKVPLQSFLEGFAASEVESKNREVPESVRPHLQPYDVKPDEELTVTRLIERLNQQIEPETIVIADIGDSLFAATELVVPGQAEFLSPAYYTSMGFGVPAALGATAIRPESRVVVIVGDGAFQMTGMELSTIVRRGCNPIVILLNNQGYGTERFLHAGDWKFNEIHSWNYHKLPEVLGGGTGYHVKTEGEFDAALSSAWADEQSMSLIHAEIPRLGASKALTRLAERMSKSI